jgi:hypothetical protein
VTAFRTIIALMIALAVAITPVGAASATVARHTANSATGPHAATAMADMDDCAKSMAGLDKQKGDCPCCESKSTCPPELCPLKLYKVFVTLEPSPLVVHPMVDQFSMRATKRPPDWLSAPQPPPPRT